MPLLFSFHSLFFFSLCSQKLITHQLCVCETGIFHNLPETPEISFLFSGTLSSWFLSLQSPDMELLLTLKQTTYSDFSIILFLDDAQQQREVRKGRQKVMGKDIALCG